MIENIILAIASIFVIYIFFIRGNKNNNYKKGFEGTSIQDLINYEYITDDGLISIGGNQYRKMVEINPTKLLLKTPEEQALVWEEYRGYTNAISVDTTEIVQTRIINISEHLEEIKAQSNTYKEKNEQMFNYGQSLHEELKADYEDTRKRDRKYFIIFKIEGDDILKNESSFDVDNALASALFSGKKNKLTDDEIKEIAVKELDSSIETVITHFHRVQMGVHRLDKKGVLDYFNNTLNRDMAISHSVDKLDKMGVFNLVPKSNTIDLFFTKKLLKRLEEREIELENFTYEDEEIENIEEKEVNNIEIQE